MILSVQGHLATDIVLQRVPSSLPFSLQEKQCGMDLLRGMPSFISPRDPQKPLGTTTKKDFIRKVSVW